VHVEEKGETVGEGEVVGQELYCGDCGAGLRGKGTGAKGRGCCRRGLGLWRGCPYGSCLSRRRLGSPLG
jgi:hypothetical protein